MTKIAPPRCEDAFASSSRLLFCLPTCLNSSPSHLRTPLFLLGLTQEEEKPHSRLRNPAAERTDILYVTLNEDDIIPW